MQQIIIALAIGVIVGRALREKPWLTHVGKITLTGVAGLLLVMGAQIGSNPEVLSALPTLGGRALVFAVFGIAGSVAFSLLLVRGRTK